jgi:hypothetical protein
MRLTLQQRRNMSSEVSLVWVRVSLVRVSLVRVRVSLVRVRVSLVRVRVRGLYTYLASVP